MRERAKSERTNERENGLANARVKLELTNISKLAANESGRPEAVKSQQGKRRELENGPEELR